jgi:hypothetical protein
MSVASKALDWVKAAIIIVIGAIIIGFIIASI